MAGWYPANGRFRSTFDVQLTKPGIWRIADVRTGAMGCFARHGKQARSPRGMTKEKVADVIPACDPSGDVAPCRCANYVTTLEVDAP